MPWPPEFRMLVTAQKTDDPEAIMFLIPLLILPLIKWFKDRKNRQQAEAEAEAEERRQEEPAQPAASSA